MNKPFKYFFLIIFLSFVIFTLTASGDFSINSLLSYISGAFSKIFQEKVTPEDLQENYKRGLTKILIVPGHDNTSPGGRFGSVVENDLNMELGQYLFDYLSKTGKFRVYITRDRFGNYYQWFSDYLSQNKEAVKTFRDYSKSVASFAKKEGWLTKEIGVIHNPAADNVSLNLYAVNKWANDNNIDIVLHIHFNDYPGRGSGVGKYTGFAIYIPEKQLPNFRVSNELAQALKNRLEKYFAKSNFPGESDTVVEDQELIAIGSNASREGASVLIEYAYLYEPQLRTTTLRSLVADELAYQTSLAIQEYFEGYLPAGKAGPISFSNDTTFLPYEWKSSLKKGEKYSEDVLRLQMALLKEDFYPPKGQSLSSCPISGIFGSCTESAVCAFQEKHNLGCVGIVGPKTLEKLNELYSI